MIFLRQSKTDRQMVEILTKYRSPADGRLVTNLGAVVLVDFLYDAGLVGDAQNNIVTDLREGKEVPCDIVVIGD